MKDIIFSSWGGKIIDNRGKDPQDFEPVDHVNLPEYFKKDVKIKALMGWDGMIIRSSDVDILDMLKNYVEANLDHSKDCDKCNYCKTGWEEQLEVYQDIFNGEASEDDLEFLESSAEAILDAGKCTIGKYGPTPIMQILKHFHDDLMQYVNGEKQVTEGNYLSKLTSPCTDACPIHLDIPKYIEKIKDAKFGDSLDVIRERLPLPGVVGRICVRPCEDHCRRANLDEPIAIRALKRFVADSALAEQKDPEFQVTPSEKTGKVAIIGAGPAGVTCAYHLALKGHAPTIYEKLPVSGGMMTVGIPRYCLPMDILEGEITQIESLGVTIKTGVSFGQDISLESLKSDGFDAVFLGPGLHGGRSLGVEGEELEGILSGVQYLRDVALGNDVQLGKKVVVVGGGNVAVDVARTVKRAGDHEVTMVCLESREEMPAWEHEIEGAKEEKVDLLNCFGPKSFTGQNGQVSEVVFKRCTCVFDDDNCFNPQYDESDLQALPADNVILAIGQGAGPDFETFQDVPLSRGGLLSDPVTYQTEKEWVFAGGDAVYGPDSVVRAAASGMKAALNIDRFINGQAIEVDDDDYFDEFFKSIKPFDPNEEVRQKVEKADRKQPAMLDPDTRVTNFDEIEQGLSNPDAIAEAERCLRCYRVVTLAV